MEAGIVVLGHGSRKGEAKEGFYRVVEMVRQSFPGLMVETAFMGNRHPNLEEAIAKLVASGIKKVVVAPLFLFSGVHVTEDIPGELEQERARYEGRVSIVYAGILGDDPRIAQVLSERIREAM
ncbi:hypothetical protein SY88_00575 [Clostridiales bacterium PH28_bin88]|nr:hypothetical protein SY88_00575 [Clostridiales bacterium PH28_bin88]